MKVPNMVRAAPSAIFRPVDLTLGSSAVLDGFFEATAFVNLLNSPGEDATGRHALEGENEALQFQHSETASEASVAEQLGQNGMG
jgi:hypothetical protein